VLGHESSSVVGDGQETYRSNNDIKRLWPEHKERGQDINMVLVNSDFGIVLAHLDDSFIPVRHRDGDTIRLGSARQLLSGSFLGELEGVLEDSVNTDSGHDGVLNDKLSIGAGEHLSTDGRVLALGIFTNDPEIDIT
jgi:hypothetical protein